VGIRRVARVHLFAHGLQRLAADVIGLLGLRHHVAEIALERGGLVIHVLAERQDPGGDPAVVRGRDDPQVVLLAGFANGVPHGLGIERGAVGVDLVALLAREAGLRDHHIGAADASCHQAVVGYVLHLFAEQVDHQRLRLRPLDLQRRDIDLLDRDVVAEANVDALEPVAQVRIADGEPELIVAQAQHDRVVEDVALVVAEDDVAPLHRGHPRHVARAHVVAEGLGVGALDPDRALDSDIPQGHVVDQRAVLDHGPALLGAHIAARMVHAVVDRRAPATGLDRQVPVGGLAHAVGDQQPNAGVAALAQIERDLAVALIDRLLVVDVVAFGHDSQLLKPLDGHPEAMPRRHGHATQSASETGLARPARRRRIPDSVGATDPFCVDNRRATPPARVDVLTDPVCRGLIDGGLPGSRIDTPCPPRRSTGGLWTRARRSPLRMPFSRRRGDAGPIDRPTVRQCPARERAPHDATIRRGDWPKSIPAAVISSLAECNRAFNGR